MTWKMRAGRPIYVHAKLCVIDDVWMAVGSDNLNLRSWNPRLRGVLRGSSTPRATSGPPLDPGGFGDGARVLARELRLALWREHLGPDVKDEELLDLRAGFDAWRRMADAPGRLACRAADTVRAPPGRARRP